MIVATHQPGCFGSPLMFSPGRGACATCAHAPLCEVEGKARRSRLEHGTAVTTSDEPAPGALVFRNPKARKVARSMMERGKTPQWCIAAVQGGTTNPLGVRGTPGFMRVAFDLLMAGSLTRPLLRETLIQRLHIGYDSACSYCAQAIEIIEVFGIATPNNEGTYETLGA